MTIEAISEASGDCDFDGYANVDEGKSATSELGGHKRHLTILRDKSKFSDAIHRTELSHFALKHKSAVQKSSTSTLIHPMESGGSVQGEISIKWGGEEGTSWSGGGSAEYHDNKGNYAKIEVKQDSDGKGNATVSAGHKEENK